MPTATPPKPRKPAPPRPQQKQDVPAPGTQPSLSHAELMEWVKRNPPPQAWFDDESDPFTPADPQPSKK